MKGNSQIWLIAVALVLVLIMVGFLGPSSIIALFLPNPVAMVGTEIILTCADTAECRGAVFSRFNGYTVSPKLQNLDGEFCNNPYLLFTVHNPLQSSDIRVTINRQVVGEVSRGNTSDFVVPLREMRPQSISKQQVSEHRTFGVDSEFLRGDSVGAFLDKNAKMGEQIEADILWKPSEEQSRAYDSIIQLNNSISSCIANLNSSNSMNHTIIDDYLQTLKSAEAAFMNCQFSTAQSVSQDAKTALDRECNILQSKDVLGEIIEKMKENWLAILIISGFIFLILSYLSNQS